MNISHTRLVMLLMVFLSLGVKSQTNRLYIPDMNMSGGGEATLSVFMDNKDEVTAVELTLELPVGFSLNPLSAALSDRASDHQITARALSNGRYKFVVMSPTNALIGGISGRLFTVRIKAPDTMTGDGNYSFAISSAVMCGPSGENLLEQADGGSVTIKTMANLHIVSLDCSNPVAGHPVTVTWTVRNDGSGATDFGQWKDYVWLVPNITAGTSMFGSKMLMAVDNVSSLLPGESYESTVNVTLDERIYGNYDLVVTSNMYGANNIDFSQTGDEAPVPYDPENADYGFLMGQGNASYVTVQEENEYNGLSDNFFYKRIYIQVPPLADIQVPHVVAVVNNDGAGLIPSPVTSAGLASSSAFYSGKNVKVTATITNAGGADIGETSISNVLYISDTPDLTGKVRRLSSHNVSLMLDAGESTTDEFIATIPYEWYGDTYFVVDVDVNDAVYELANTANNKGSSDLINTLLTPGADFEPYNLTVPGVVSSGKSFDVSYSVRNIGPGIPFSNSWNDKVYISTKSTGLDNTARLIGQRVHQAGFKTIALDGHLDASDFQYEGDNYSATCSANVSDLPAGTYYIYLHVDADDAVLEYDGEDNNVIVSEAIELNVPDLVVELVSVSEQTMSTGSKVAVSWRLKNVGTADIQNASVTDGFYASRSSNTAEDISLGTATNLVSIVAGGEKVLRTNITIPKDSRLNGTCYLYVRTNIGNTVKETLMSNNTSLSVSGQFVYAEDPADASVDGTNLTVHSLQARSMVSPGESISISYSVKNTGSVIIDREVGQELFISRKSDLDASAKLLTPSSPPPTLTGLQAGAIVNAQVSAILPADLQGGQYYLFVAVNRNKSLVEKRTDDNQEKTPIYISGNLPNLVVGDLHVPATVMTSEQVEVSWTLTNAGSWSANGIACDVYLSSNSTLDATDRRIESSVSGQLPIGASEQMRAMIELADDVVGTRYLIVKANTDGIEELASEDNQVSKSFMSQQSPLPDLTISGLVADENWHSGQSINVKATVKNQGESETRKDKWTDVFYLSESYTLDIGNAIMVGSKTHVGKLMTDESYQLSADLNVPQLMSGYYVLFVVVDGTNSLVELSEDNNRALTTVYISGESASPADLVVEKLNVSSSITAGEPLTVSYRISNQGEFAASGKLCDVLYMSDDAQWDVNDVMIGVVTGDVYIEPGTDITRTATGRITNVPEGDYYLFVRTNSTHSIAESDYGNNQVMSQTASSVMFRTLELGSSATVNTSGLFKLPLHSGLNGKTIGVYLSTPDDASAGLYTAFESVPSTARYELSASDIEADRQEVLIPNVQEGNYYILAQDNAAIGRSLNDFVLDGEQDLMETMMTLSAQEVPFGATTLSINQGGTNGWISTEIHGALFDSIMDFRLAHEQVLIPAESITFHNQTLSKATFNLNDAEVGPYDVVSELPDGTQATLNDGFRVVPGTNVALSARLSAPPATRVNGYGPVSVTYVNGGNTDVVIRELLLTIRGGQLSTTIEGFQSNPQTELHIRPNVMQDNRGFVVIAPGKQETLNYYFKQTAGMTYINLYIVK